MIGLLLLFPRCLLMATVRDHLLGWTDHRSAPVQPVLTWERISTAGVAWMHQNVMQPTLPWGSSPPPLMGRNRTAGKEQVENGSVWPEQLSDAPHWGHMAKSTEKLAYPSWDKQKNFVILMSMSSFSKYYLFHNSLLIMFVDLYISNHIFTNRCFYLTSCSIYCPYSEQRKYQQIPFLMQIQRNDKETRK